MLPHQQRVVDEKKELDEKLEKLTAFFSTNIFSELPQEEQNRLRRQQFAMTDYSTILGERIDNF